MTEKVTSLKDVLVAACDHVLQTYGLSGRFMCELSESSLNSAEEINIIAGLSKGLDGTIVVGLTKDTAFNILSHMAGGVPINFLDSVTKSGLAEFGNLIMAVALRSIKTQEVIDLSPPTLAIGEDMFLMISKVPSKKIFYKLGDSKLSIAYCLN